MLDSQPQIGTNVKFAFQVRDSNKKYSREALKQTALEKRSILAKLDIPDPTQLLDTKLSKSTSCNVFHGETLKKELHSLLITALGRLEGVKPLKIEVFEDENMTKTEAIMKAASKKRSRQKNSKKKSKKQANKSERPDQGRN